MGEARGRTVSLAAVVDRIVRVHDSIRRRRSLLVAISGIDGCGKGYVTARLVEELRARSLHPAALHVDGWLNLPEKRFHPASPAEHFYRHAIRFAEMFEQLVLPLRDRRSVHVVADYVEETATEYRGHVYDYRDVDVILLEGIYLLKRAHRGHYDLSVWIDCSFDTALERAIARGQEGLSPEETIRAYRTIYFPAQEIHLGRDDPRAAATILLDNETRSVGA